MIRMVQLVSQSLQGVMRSRLRSLLTTLGIAISSGALVSMVAFAVGLQAQFELPIQKLGLLNDIEVRPGDKGAVLDDLAVEKIRKVRGVSYVYPDFRLSQLNVVHGKHNRSSMALGLPREASLIQVFDEMIVAGEYFSLGTEPQALVSDRSLRDLGFDSPQAAIGQTLQIEVSGLDAKQPNQFELRKHQTSVRVVGVYRAPGIMEEFGHGALLLPADVMRDMPGLDFERTLRRLRSDKEPLKGYSRVTVRADSPQTAFRLEKKIAAMGYEARAVAGRIKEARRAFLFMEVLLSAVGTVGLVVAGLGIMNTLLMSVMERYQEIGIYKAIGASDSDVGILFLTEAAVLGLIGGLSGLALARVVCWGLQWAIGIYASREGIEEFGDVFRFPLWLLAGAVAYAVLISLLSGVYPATRAARIDPIRALRGR